MDFKICKRKIATLWFAITLIIYIILFFQTIIGIKHGSYVSEIWSWILQATVPTISVIIGAFMADGFHKKDEEEEKKVKKNVFQISYFISLLYLVILLSIILLQPIINRPLHEVIKTSGLYLAPLNGLVTTSLAIFFINQNKE